jgi:hypothetical protein
MLLEVTELQILALVQALGIITAVTPVPVEAELL